MVADAELGVVGVVGVPGAEQVFQVGVVLRPHILVADGEGYGGTQRYAVHQTRKPLHLVGLLARGAEAAAFQLAGYKIHIQPYSRRTAVDYSTYGGSVGLAVGRYSESFAVGVHLLGVDFQ